MEKPISHRLVIVIIYRIPIGDYPDPQPAMAAVVRASRTYVCGRKKAASGACYKIL
jgi:hypothetical protein